MRNAIHAMEFWTAMNVLRKSYVEMTHGELEWPEAD